MNEPWPEEAAWTERLLLVASGEEPRTPELEAALRDDPRVRALWGDLQLLEAAPPPDEAVVAPRLAIARAREAFDAEAPSSWFERLRSALLVPALAGVVALAMGLGTAPGTASSWDGAHLEAHLQHAAEDLAAWEDELAPEPLRAGAPLAWEPRELAWLVQAEDPDDFWDGPAIREGWSQEELGSPWEALEDDLTDIEQALERL